jgi:ketosteroid isomerase-like protein
MSENLDLVRSIYAAWERGDLSESDWAHPEIEYVIPDGPAPGAWRGLSGMAEGVRTWLTAWQGFRAEAVEYRELDPERVLVLHRYGGQGKSSGLTLGQMHGEGASLFTVRGGKVVRNVFYLDRNTALADLALKDG